MLPYYEDDLRLPHEQGLSLAAWKKIAKNKMEKEKKEASKPSIPLRISLKLAMEAKKKKQRKIAECQAIRDAASKDAMFSRLRAAARASSEAAQDARLRSATAPMFGYIY